MEKLFNLSFESNQNKLNFYYISNSQKKIHISIKDIDSKACIYSFDIMAHFGASFWAIPSPKSVYDFESQPNFGGFLIEYRENDLLIDYDELRIKEIQSVKTEFNFSNTEPIFMNYNEFFEEKIYDNFDIQNLNVVFDVGANVGLWSQFILTRGAKNIYCFEPNKIALDNLNFNLGKNKRVRIIPYGLYHEKTQIPFYVSESNSLVSSTLKENQTSNEPSYYIETVTLDEMIANYNLEKIDLLKIDIEGAEFAIFDNISDETLAKIDSVLIEYHDFYFEDGLNKVEKLKQKLIDSGFHITKPDNHKFIFGYKVKKNYYIDIQDNIELRNLYNYSKSFAWENYHKGTQNKYHHMFNELYFAYDINTNGSSYERFGCKIEKGDIVVDIGANIGIFSNYAFEKGASKIFSFEPLNLAFNCLMRNKPKNCEIFKMGVLDTNSFEKIFSPVKNDTMGSSLFKNGEEYNICPITTINNLFENNLFDRIDFLKIDTEGSEYKILNDISYENFQKINKISLEYHGDIVSYDQFEELVKKLTSYGFKSYVLNYEGSPLKIYNFWR